MWENLVATFFAIVIGLGLIELAAYLAQVQ